MKNLVAVAVLTGLVVTAGAVFTASKSDDELLQRARDREQIEDLMWRYARALDTSDAQTYASLYTVDGQFSAGANATKGREALKNMISGTGQRQAGAPQAAPRPPMYHMTANHQLCFIDKDHARIDAYYITMVAAAGPDTPSRVAGVGRSIDELERVNGQWLIKSRNVAPMD
jgi:3-phenylpropionate/cinnamic acid dioxygenase small subunit